MRKGFIVVLCIVISVLVWAEESTQATSSVHLPKVYPYYVLVNDDETFGLSLNFEYNTFNELNRTKAFFRPLKRTSLLIRLVL